jgi:uncharacterized protein (DUF2235 family)
MAPPPPGNPITPRNIGIFSDGTGQRGGVYFDEARTNIYKLYRAARCAPDSSIPPERQLAFYDPGLGTRPAGAGVTSVWRTIYNYVSQATGLGITHNIIDCYAAIIELWRPGDRIFFFGFSRGAYTVRCLSTALCYSGIPTQDGNGRPLKRDKASVRKLATRAVKTVYQHVSSPRDMQFFAQRQALAQKFRGEYACSDDPSAFPYFIGVFDTVAALSDRAALVVLTAAYVALLTAASFALGSFTSEGAAYWGAWLGFDTICVLIAAYVYTHLKFSFRLPGYHWWETVHLTSFRQKFYDQDLDDRIGYARHAISIDERRADFKRVRWGTPRADIERPKIDRFQQVWFAGNHADIGGGYPENESRLSDIPLKWMIEAASDGLGDKGLLLDRTVLEPRGAADSMQHDETRSVVFRLAGKSDRDPVPDATLHDTVGERFNVAGGVLQYDIVAPYRPEALRGHHKFPGAYDNVPLPRQTCAQRLRAAYKAAPHGKDVRTGASASSFKALEENEMDRVVSCGALLLTAIAFTAGTAILGYQGVTWLQSGLWTPMPLDLLLGSIRSIGSNWIGLQKIYDWILALPLVVALYVLGIIVFWIGGVVSAAQYKQAAQDQANTITPAQIHA